MKLNKEQIEFIKSTARILVDDGDNKEYTRGIAELIADLDSKFDVDHADRADEITAEITTQ